MNNPPGVFLDTTQQWLQNQQWARQDELAKQAQAREDAKAAAAQAQIDQENAARLGGYMNMQSALGWQPGQAAGSNPYMMGLTASYGGLSDEIAKQQAAQTGAKTDYLKAYTNATEWTPERRTNYMDSQYGIYSNAADAARIKGQASLVDRGITGGGGYERLARGIEQSKLENVANSMGETWKPSGILPNYQPYADTAKAMGRSAYAETLLPLTSAYGQMTMNKDLNPSLYPYASSPGVATTQPTYRPGLRGVSLLR